MLPVLVLAAKYRIYLKNREFIFSAVLGIALLFVSLFVNFYAGIYANERASNAVEDLILSNTRVYDVDSVFIYGSILFWLFVAFVCMLEPKRIPFTLKSIALFVLIRSVFISLTHIGPFPNQITIDPLSIINKFSSGADLFFSAHTGLPFLMALIFWGHARLRVFFICLAFLFGAVVLMGHLHYSIDVLAAFFITYTIFHVAEIIFKKDRKVFEDGLVP